MYGDFSKDLDLSTLQGGQLNQDFIERYKDVLSSLGKGEQGKITINVVIKRPKDMDSMVQIETNVQSQKPKRSRTEYGTIKIGDNDEMSVKVEKPKERLKPVSLFDANEKQA
jgi:hypothetical protein